MTSHTGSCQSKSRTGLADGAAGVVPTVPVSWISVTLIGLILCGIAMRCFRIDLPLFDGHGYRQHDTAAIARNFAEESMNAFYPRVDWRGESSGFAETEFQIYTFTVAVLYKTFGVHEFLGRGLNVCLFVLSAGLLFLFIQAVFDERAALIGVFFYCIAPLAVFYNRSFQPDTLLALASLFSIYAFWRWSQRLRWPWLVLSGLGLTIAVLIKPPSLYLGLPLLYLAHLRFGRQWYRQHSLWLFAVLVLIPPFLWYWHAYQLWEIHGNTFGLLGRRSIAGVWPLNDRNWHLLGARLAHRLTHEIATPVGLLLLAAGLLTRQSRVGRLLLYWSLGFLVYIVLVPRGHSGHDYYQLPFVFVACAYIGFGATVLVDRGVLPKHALLALLIFALPMSALELQGKLVVRDYDEIRIPFARQVFELTQPDELVVFVVPVPKRADPGIYRHRTVEGEYLYCDPIDLYNSHRKGWSLDADQATPARLEQLRQKGARCLATVFPKVFNDNPLLGAHAKASFTPLDVNDVWHIYRIEAAEVTAGDPRETTLPGTDPGR